MRTSYIKKIPPYGQEFFDMAPATGICSALLCFRHESGGPMLRTLFCFASLAEWLLRARVISKKSHPSGRSFLIWHPQREFVPPFYAFVTKAADQCCEPYSASLRLQSGFSAHELYQKNPTLRAGVF